MWAIVGIPRCIDKTIEAVKILNNKVVHIVKELP